MLSPSWIETMTVRTMSRGSITASGQVVRSLSFSALTGNAQALYYRLMFEADDDGFIEFTRWNAVWEDGFSLATFFELCSLNLLLICEDDRFYICDYDLHKQALERAVEEWDEDDSPW